MLIRLSDDRTKDRRRLNCRTARESIPSGEWTQESTIESSRAYTGSTIDEHDERKRDRAHTTLWAGWSRESLARTARSASTERALGCSRTGETRTHARATARRVPFFIFNCRNWRPLSASLYSRFRRDGRERSHSLARADIGSDETRHVDAERSARADTRVKPECEN